MSDSSGGDNGDDAGGRLTSEGACAARAGGGAPLLCAAARLPDAPEHAAARAPLSSPATMRAAVRLLVKESERLPSALVGTGVGSGANGVGEAGSAPTAAAVRAIWEDRAAVAAALARAAPLWAQSQPDLRLPADQWQALLRDLEDQPPPPPVAVSDAERALALSFCAGCGAKARRGVRLRQCTGCHLAVFCGVSRWWALV
ncbi:MAG: hypothetical protein J3K34DRAFT_399610 [Monoraphidium minutum]|nr:MAG: hypothetical protein J3K34DRAFT_399610 [Monoraphidium minutum]